MSAGVGGRQLSGSDLILCGVAVPVTKAVGRGLRLIDKVASGSHLAGMRTVGLKVLKNKLSEYVRAAASGETVVITDRGHPIAELVAPRQVPDRYKDHPVLARGIREGWITPARNPGGEPPPPTPVPEITFDRLMADLARDRADR